MSKREILTGFILMIAFGLFAQETNHHYVSEDERIFHELEGLEEPKEFYSLNQWNSPQTLTLTKPENRTSSEFYFTFQVDSSLYGMELELQSNASLDLFINHESNEVDMKGKISQGQALRSINLSRFSAPRLADGLYYGVVVYHSSRPHTETINFQLTLKEKSLPIAATLTPNKAATYKMGGSLENQTAFYEISLPVEAKNLRVDIFECATDVDLYLFAGKPDYRLDYAIAKGETYAGCESLLLSSQTKPAYQPGQKYFLMIYDRHPSMTQDKISFVVTTQKEAALVARKAMTLPVVTENRRQNALSATVELLCEQSTGTGFIVSPKGYILTALHVLKRADGTLSKSIIGAVNLDEKKAAAERFRLKLIASDEKNDIALLKIDSMLFGAFPTEVTTLPFFTLGGASTVEMGDTLLTLGYPKSGGGSSKNSVKMARGILSGYERRQGVDFIVSDIKADAGNSGGPVFDSLYRLVGISQSLLQSDYSYLLSIFPIEALPPSWLDIINGR